MVGPQARDVGLVLAWPLACMVAHALKHTESNANIQIRHFVETFLKCYLSEMRSGRTAKEMASIYRRCLPSIAAASKTIKEALEETTRMMKMDRWIALGCVKRICLVKRPR